MNGLVGTRNNNNERLLINNVSNTKTIVIYNSTATASTNANYYMGVYDYNLVLQYTLKPGESIVLDGALLEAVGDTIYLMGQGSQGFYPKYTVIVTM